MPSSRIVLQHHVLGRDGRVGLELEHPVAVGLLQAEQRLVPRSIEASSRRSIASASPDGSAILIPESTPSRRTTAAKTASLWFKLGMISRKTRCPAGV